MFMNKNGGLSFLFEISVQLNRGGGIREMFTKCVDK